MIFVGIDVAKNKHDCYILDSSKEMLDTSFTFTNTLEGFNSFKSILNSYTDNFLDIKIGLESTGHYNNNIVNFINKNSLELKIFNPLAVNLYRKALTLRKTKTDKIDAQFIAQMLFSDDSEPYLPIDYHINDLKSLARHRYRMVGHRGKLKISLTRILDIAFPELSTVVWSIHPKSCYTLLLELPTIEDISKCHLTKLTNILYKASKGHYGKEKAKEIKELAKTSIGTSNFFIGLELQQTIRLIQHQQDEINISNKIIKKWLKKLIHLC
jgi:transposase